MSENYGSAFPTGPEESDTSTSKVETAKQEASAVKDTAAAEAGHVVETAKDEVANVAAEAKSQAKQLYAQTTSELRSQAEVQQQRAAAGLSAIGDELRSIASGTPSQSPGLATDLVREASNRVSSAATWLGDRDPASLLSEVKSYARRKPGTFIILAAVAGIVAGRLARALTENRADDKAEAESTPSSLGDATPVGYAQPGAPLAVDDFTETPLYAERSASLAGGASQEGTGYDRRDSV